jgi:hypothetical protein
VQKQPFINISMTGYIALLISSHCFMLRYEGMDTKHHSPRHEPARVVNNKEVSLHVVVQKARAVSAKQWRLAGKKPRPYVTATLLPFQWTMKTEQCAEIDEAKPYDETCVPEWSRRQKNHLEFKPKEGALGQLTLVLELWNASSNAMYSDRFMGSARVNVPDKPGVPQQQRYSLAGKKDEEVGELICSVYIEGVKDVHKRRYRALKQFVDDDEQAKKRLAWEVKQCILRNPNGVNGCDKFLCIDIHTASGLRNTQTMWCSATELSSTHTLL